MFSVEDLLISHGYKLPKHSTASSTPTPAPSSSTRNIPHASPPSYSRYHELLENRPRTVNGFEGHSRMPFGDSSQMFNCPNNSEAKDRSLSRQECKGHSAGQSLTPDTGFCDVDQGPQPQSKDVSYWRRKGQDFAVLLDCAGYKEPNGGGEGSNVRPGGPQQARGQELSTEERQRTAHERKQWMPQVQAEARYRDRELALRHWRMASERKSQSLGTEEWHPAVSFSHQLSQSEGERWTEGQQWLYARTPEGMVVHPQTKAKTQSLPRILLPESLQYVDIGTGHELFKRVSGHPLLHQGIYRAARWPENGRPASANQLSVTPKPRFTRPPRPPSYEMHQQIRGSCEVLSGRDSQARDRTPLPMLRTAESQLDYFAEDSGPPGYIPPPSYKRAPIMPGGCREYGEVAINYRYRGDVYQQVQVAPDGSHWVPRHQAGSWPDSRHESNMSHQRQRNPVYTCVRPGGRIQYVPYDDPHITNISSALGGNSLTDADKIRHICKELPSVRVSEPASDDSAFLPPPLGPSIAGKLSNDSNLTSSSEFDNDNNRWHSNLHKETVDNIPATDQNCNNRYSKIHHGPPLFPSSAFHAPNTSPGSRCSSEQGFSETITQVKQITPDSGPDNNRNTKRRVSETIFCLVSVPVHTPTNCNKYASADQNNNTRTTLTIPNTFAVGLKESRPVRSRSVNQEPIWSNYSHFHTSSTTSLRNYKRAPLRKETIDAWALQANEDRELCYSRSWPGNQYRNQETQTGSPLTVVKSPETQSPEQKNMSTDSGRGTNSCSSYGYPIEGQKNLHPSSNSAFSILSPTQAPSAEALPPEPAPLLTQPNKGDLLPSSPKKKISRSLDSPPNNPTESTEQVVFGQFLLKPVNRRPCDAIGELESINKKMEDTISKRPNVGLCGVNKRHNRLKSGVQSVEELIFLPMHADKPSIIKVRSKSFTSTTDLDTIEIRSCFSRPQRDSRPSTQEQAGSRDNYLTSVSQDSEPTHQDIPVPQESLLRDVGLTVYTETHSGPRELEQRSCSVPPLEQCVALSWDSRTKTSKNRDSLEHNLNEELKAKTDYKPNLSGVSVRICRSRSESSRSSHKRECSPHVIKLNREVSCLFENDPLKKSNVSTIADKHLENLLIQEKANSLPAEDLSNLYEVKCAKGIPDNEPIEERAARILGIAVPVESLGVVDKQKDKNQNNVDAEQEVTTRSVEVIKESLVHEEEKVKRVNHEDRHKHSSIHPTDLQQTEENESEAIGLTEFPLSKFSLSLPVAQDQDLLLTMTTRTSCKLIESQQDNHSSSAVCLGTDSTAQLKELDTISGISSVSPLGSDGKETSSLKDGQSTEAELQEEAVKMSGGVYNDSGKEEENPYKKQPANETQDKLQQECDSEEVEVQECKQSQGVDQGSMKIQTDSIESEGIQEVAELRAEDPKELKLIGVEDSKKECAEITRESTGGGRNMAKASNAEVTPRVTAAPKPKQHTKLKKPPLLPKPRTVPKREITLPRSFSTGTWGPANMENKDTSAISDSYDPSRVERV